MANTENDRDEKRSDSQVVLTIQPDWYKILSSEERKAWITMKERGENGHHGFLLHDVSGVIASDKKFILDKVTQGELVIRHKDVPQVKFKVISPEREFMGLHKKNVVSMDVAEGGLGVSSGDGGASVNVWETGSGVLRRSLEGHFGEVYSCRLFPSGVVVLSTGADMRIKIWSAEDGSCPVTLEGHKAPVTATAIVDKGMNIVTGSKDGTVRLWSCGKMKCLEPPIHVGDVVNCCDLVSLRSEELAELRFPISPDALDDETEIHRTDEVGTEGKLLVVGGESGWLVFVNLYLRKAVYRCKLDSAVNVVRFFDKKNVLVGTEDGGLSSYDLTRSEHPTVICHDSNSSIQSLLALPIGFIIGRMDGSCVFYPVKDGCFPHDNSSRAVLSGADVDPINSIVSDGEFVYTAGRDGIIRKYLISNLTF